MSKSFKKRKKIIEEEILDQTGTRIYLEKNIKKIMQKRYNKQEIKIDSSYIYQKMSVLIDSKIYLECRNIPKLYISSSGYVNIFDLHKQLSDIIRKYHLPNIDSKIYTEDEKQYMKTFKT